jgi:hypothetical protein
VAILLVGRSPPRRDRDGHDDQPDRDASDQDEDDVGKDGGDGGNDHSAGTLPARLERDRTGRSAVPYDRTMGSKGRKARKPSHSQHLPKVGTSAAREHELQEERHAVLDVMGIGNVPIWAKVAIVLVGVALLVLALWGLAF